MKRKRANPWGLQDMLGNVWEWVEDPDHPDYVGAPADGSVWLNDGAGGRVLRGGSWADYASGVRSAGRTASAPRERINHIGFRCARVQG